MFKIPEYYPQSIKTILKSFKFILFAIIIAVSITISVIVVKTYNYKLPNGIDFWPIIKIILSGIAILASFIGMHIQFKKIYHEPNISNTIVKYLTLFLIIAYVLLNIIAILLMPKHFLNFNSILNAQSYIITIILAMELIIPTLFIMNKADDENATVIPSILGLLPFSINSIIIMATSLQQFSIFVVPFFLTIPIVSLNGFFILMETINRRIK